jgi:hypothetical protein
MRVLALDPGSNCGATWGDPGGKPVIDCLRMASKMSLGRRFCTLEGALRRIISTYEIDAVFAEGVWIPRDPTKLDGKAFSMGYGWQAAIRMACEKEGIQADSLHIIPPDEWRKMALERTKAPSHIKGASERRAWLKNAALIECEIRGWTVTNHDAAESALLWEFGCEYVQPQATLNRLPLFQLATL